MNELLSGFAPSQIEWIRVNAPLVRSTLTRMAHSSAETQKRREERRVKLLTRHKHLFHPGAESFCFFTDFQKKNEASHNAVKMMDGLFPDEFSNLVELRVPSIELVVSRILHGDNDKGTPYPTEPEIRQRIGEGRAELRLAHICFFLEQADTEFWHVFYARGRSGVMRLVSASWSKGWYLSAANVGYLDEWRNGGCVVSQDF